MGRRLFIAYGFADRRVCPSVVCALLGSLLLASTAWAQAPTIVLAIYDSTVTDANLAIPVLAPVTYTALMCGLTPKLVETPPIANPFEAYIDDPADPTKDCRVSIQAQIQSLPPGRSYRAAVRDPVSGEPYGPLSTVFAKQGRKVRVR